MSSGLNVDCSSRRRPSNGAAAIGGGFGGELGPFGCSLPDIWVPNEASTLPEWIPFQFDLFGVRFGETTGDLVATLTLIWRASLTFLLQGELPLGLDVLQRGGQVPGEAAGAARGHRGALRRQETTVSSCRSGGGAVIRHAHLWVAPQRGRAQLKGRRRTRAGLMGRRTRVAVQLGAEHLGGGGGGSTKMGGVFMNQCDQVQ